MLHLPVLSIEKQRGRIKNQVFLMTYLHIIVYRTPHAADARLGLMLKTHHKFYILSQLQNSQGLAARGAFFQHSMAHIGQ